jgi:hypothetical protein
MVVNLTVNGQHLQTVLAEKGLTSRLRVHNTQTLVSQYGRTAAPYTAPVRTTVTDPAAHFQGFPAQDVRLLLHIENANYSTHNS